MNLQTGIEFRSRAATSDEVASLPPLCRRTLQSLLTDTTSICSSSANLPFPEVCRDSQCPFVHLPSLSSNGGALTSAAACAHGTDCFKFECPHAHPSARKSLCWVPFCAAPLCRKIHQKSDGGMHQGRNTFRSLIEEAETIAALHPRLSLSDIDDMVLCSARARGVSMIAYPCFQSSATATASAASGLEATIASLAAAAALGHKSSSEALERLQGFCNDALSASSTGTTGRAPNAGLSEGATSTGSEVQSLAEAMRAPSPFSHALQATALRAACSRAGFFPIPAVSLSVASRAREQSSEGKALQRAEVAKRGTESRCGSESDALSASSYAFPPAEWVLDKEPNPAPILAPSPAGSSASASSPASAPASARVSVRSSVASGGSPLSESGADLRIVRNRSSPGSSSSDPGAGSCSPPAHRIALYVQLGHSMTGVLVSPSLRVIDLVAALIADQFIPSPALASDVVVTVGSSLLSPLATFGDLALSSFATLTLLLAGQTAAVAAHFLTFGGPHRPTTSLSTRSLVTGAVYVRPVRGHSHLAEDIARMQFQVAPQLQLMAAQLVAAASTGRPEWGKVLAIAMPAVGADDPHVRFNGIAVVSDRRAARVSVSSFSSAASRSGVGYGRGAAFIDACSFPGHAGPLERYHASHTHAPLPCPKGTSCATYGCAHSHPVPTTPNGLRRALDCPAGASCAFRSPAAVAAAAATVAAAAAVTAGTASPLQAATTVGLCTGVHPDGLLAQLQRQTCPAKGGCRKWDCPAQHPPLRRVFVPRAVVRFVGLYGLLVQRSREDSLEDLCDRADDNGYIGYGNDSGSGSEIDDDVDDGCDEDQSAPTGEKSSGVLKPVKVSLLSKAAAPFAYSHQTICGPVAGGQEFASGSAGSGVSTGRSLSAGVGAGAGGATYGSWNPAAAGLVPAMDRLSLHSPGVQHGYSHQQQHASLAQGRFSDQQQQQHGERSYVEFSRSSSSSHVGTPYGSSGCVAASSSVVPQHLPADARAAAALMAARTDVGKSAKAFTFAQSHHSAGAISDSSSAAWGDAAQQGTAVWGDAAQKGASPASVGVGRRARQTLYPPQHPHALPQQQQQQQQPQVSRFYSPHTQQRPQSLQLPGRNLSSATDASLQSPYTAGPGAAPDSAPRGITLTGSLGQIQMQTQAQLRLQSLLVAQASNQAQAHGYGRGQADEGPGQGRKAGRRRQVGAANQQHGGSSHTPAQDPFALQHPQHQFSTLSLPQHAGSVSGSSGSSGSGGGRGTYLPSANGSGDVLTGLSGGFTPGISSVVGGGLGTAASLSSTTVGSPSWDRPVCYSASGFDSTALNPPGPSSGLGHNSRSGSGLGLGVDSLAGSVPLSGTNSFSSAHGAGVYGTSSSFAGGSSSAAMGTTMGLSMGVGGVDSFTGGRPEPWDNNQQDNLHQTREQLLQQQQQLQQQIQQQQEIMVQQLQQQQQQMMMLMMMLSKNTASTQPAAAPASSSGVGADASFSSVSTGVNAGASTGASANQEPRQGAGHDMSSLNSLENESLYQINFPW